MNGYSTKMQIRQKTKKKNTLSNLIFLYLISLLMPCLAVAVIIFIVQENETRSWFDQYGVNVQATITDHWVQKSSKGGISARHISYTYTVNEATGQKLYSGDRKVTEEEYNKLAAQSQVTARYLSYQPQFSRLVEGEEDFVIQSAFGLVVIGIIELFCTVKIVIHQVQRRRRKYRLATWGY